MVHSPSIKPRRAGSYKSLALGPELETKQRPVQVRAMSTFDAILDIAAELLGEVGIERLSTNLICSRAGITPPALYRYFPNKYAILKELGERLMRAQDEALLDWLETQLSPQPEDWQAALTNLVMGQFEVTLKVPGACWILRAIRAVPALAPVRAQSSTLANDAAFARMVQIFPAADPAALALAIRLSITTVYACVETVADDPSLDQTRAGAEIADMIARYFLKFQPVP